MKLILSISSLLLLFVVSSDALNPSPMSENDMYRCYYVILCDLRKPEEFQQLVYTAGPETTAKAMEWMREVTKIEDAEDTPEFWKKYPGIKCAYPEETKKDMFYEWIKLAGEYWIEQCEDPESDTCQNTEAAANQIFAVFAKYTASGDCKPEGAEMAADAAKDMQGKVPGGMNKMAPPSFG
ncbi:uncharacterized protein CDAR_443891 [Caerostris darwini]|uniref:Uncharacterized protein n=1 Tax=Caerostris darwini TaxID=1538125 RepID=A0AAV4X7M2_9ARAC|nr:uncharacterized protein CDAR_443891 [Caerostris darwini]